MELQTIIKELEYFEGTFPRHALEAAIAAQEQVTPLLLPVLAHSPATIHAWSAQKAYMAHIYTLFLLAQFRESRAYPLIINFFATPGEMALDVTGDVVTEYLDRILASVCGGDDRLIKQLAENQEANEFVRGAALAALVCLVATGEKAREEVLAYYQTLLQSDCPQHSSFFYAEVVASATDLYPEEVAEDLKAAFANGWVDETIIDRTYVERQLAQGKEAVVAKLHNERYQLIDDTVKELEWWACFQPPRIPREVKKKVGRNEPCPCGSGKKYKKCCGA
jgi:Protein of unknown function (DUF1186)/SEC-C motif